MLIANGQEFEREHVAAVSDKVGKLQVMYRAVETGGSHGALNELRALNSSLMGRWRDFEKSFQSHMANLDLSLKFQEKLFEVYNIKV